MEKEVNQYGDKSIYVEKPETVNIYQSVEKSQLNSDDILSGFNRVSTDLSSYKNKFEDKIQHIERTETSVLYNWIMSEH